ncbi:hypothetical protein ACFXD5_12060 [Streptomyces sp. NPDC059385]|uniref:hypothetical protein n=1 Tax=Streptomyces sp. NPDC059385 TaxID=3346817 RepID=UPI003682DD8D
MARISEIHLGARFGKLTVVGELIRSRPASVPMRCDCGTEKVMYVHHVGGSRSCGCAKIGATRTHGMSHTPEYAAWERMIFRCTNPNDKRWADYGGRGISVYPTFRADFTAFYAEVGPRPTPDHSLDRIDNDRGYEPGNLRWATRSQQSLNQRRRTVCKRGHRIEGDNEHIGPTGARRCRACLKYWEQIKTEKRRAARAADPKETPDA